jgi:hypothetical protein
LIISKCIEVYDNQIGCNWSIQLFEEWVIFMFRNRLHVIFMFYDLFGITMLFVWYFYPNLVVHWKPSKTHKVCSFLFNQFFSYNALNTNSLLFIMNWIPKIQIWQRFCPISLFGHYQVSVLCNNNLCLKLSDFTCLHLLSQTQTCFLN